MEKLSPLLQKLIDAEQSLGREKDLLVVKELKAILEKQQLEKQQP